MTTKEKLKSEIDKLPDDLVARVYKLVLSEQEKININPVRKQLKAYHLGKELDDIDIRKAAYE